MKLDTLDEIKKELDREPMNKTVTHYMLSRLIEAIQNENKEIREIIEKPKKEVI